MLLLSAPTTMVSTSTVQTTGPGTTTTQQGTESPDQVKLLYLAVNYSEVSIFMPISEYSYCVITWSASCDVMLHNRYFSNDDTNDNVYYSNKQRQRTGRTDTREHIDRKRKRQTNRHRLAPGLYDLCRDHLISSSLTKFKTNLVIFLIDSGSETIKIKSRMFFDNSNIERHRS